MEICAAFYEDAAKDNAFYKVWPNQAHFVRKRWKDFVIPARNILISMLSGNYPQQMKDEIYEAILHDRELPGAMDYKPEHFTTH